MTTDLSSLIERIEAAPGPNREIDAAIELAFTDDRGVRPLAFFKHKITIGKRRTIPFTASIDAAITLVPTGWIVEIRRYFNNDGEFVSAVSLTDSFTVGRGCDPEEEVTVSSRIVERRQGIDPTPLALCAAALKARTPSHDG